MADQQNYSSRRQASSALRKSRPLWQYYTGITALLLVMVVALAGGIIWYHSKKTNQLAIAAAERMMIEAGEDVSNRIQLLYDPMYAIVGISALVPELTSPAIKDDPHALELILRVLRIYPQILSLYVGFDTGEFFMVTHIGGENAAPLRDALQAPPNAVFANEIVSLDAAGNRETRWIFLGEDGTVVGRHDPVPAEFDPRGRPWYDSAKRSDAVEQSDLYVFATSGEAGFTLSRSFAGPPAGVIGADLAATDLARFLRDQHITPSSTAFIFTKTGEVIALPDAARIAKAVRSDGKMLADPPKIGYLNDPVIAGLVAAYENGRMSGTRFYDVEGRTYVGRVLDIPPRYGRDQLLAIMVPLDEIEKPIIEIRNQSLLYSIAFLVFALPLYLTLVVAWIDRRLEGRIRWPGSRDDD
ncbi:MAG: cache domain-containing protein [Alphaproteobacteria bacterium]|nr:cache domain-containing protein [Alphaproteobacteria bacterium]